MAYLSLLALMLLSQESLPDRIAGTYPVLFATGPVALEGWVLARRSRGPAFLTWIVAWAAIFAPLGLPLLDPEPTARWAGLLGVVPQMERGAGKRSEPPQWLADRLGWEQLVDEVAAVRSRLAPEDLERVVFFAPSYGQAGALEWLGRERGLGPSTAATTAGSCGDHRPTPWSWP